MKSLFIYEVNPQDQCEKLKRIAVEQGHNKFIGFLVVFSFSIPTYNPTTFFFTINRNIFIETPLHKTFNIKSLNKN